MARSSQSPPPDAQASLPAAAAAVRRRRFWAPEVIQTSAMDCGPAALKCLLEGFGIPVSYGRLREACQTSVDGTSIDAVEELAGRLGLEAEQILLPPEHVGRPEAGVLPAIAIVILPGGVTHFVVLWRSLGSFIQVMDPARGRRWVRASVLERDLYPHRMTVAAVDFAAYARAPGFVAAFLGRLRRLLPSRAMPAVRAALEAALAALPAEGSRLAAIDGAVGTVEALKEAGIRVTRAQAERVLRMALAPADPGRAREPLASVLGLRAGMLPAADAGRARDAPDASQVPGTSETSKAGESLGGSVGESVGESVIVRGTVVVRILGRRERGGISEPAPGLPRELAAALETSPSSLWRKLLALLEATRATRVPATSARRLGPWSAVAILLISLAGLGTMAELLAARPLLSGRMAHGAASSALAILIATVGVAGAMELAFATVTRRLGRALDVALRTGFLRKLPRMSRQYFSSRPVSDMAERAHAAYRLAELPTLVARSSRLFLEIALAALIIFWLYPAGAPIAVGVCASALLAMWVAVPILNERDLRLRTHAGALVRHSLDVLLGLLVIRTHGAAVAITRAHEVRLSEWRRAGRDLNRASLLAEAAVVIVGALGAGALLLGLSRVGGSDLTAGSRLALLFLALGLPTQVAALTMAWRRVPDARNVALRLIEPLGAPEDDDAQPPATGASGTASTLPPAASSAVSIRLGDVSVEAGGHVILSHAELIIAPGSHVAIIGASGAGKSTLLGLLLGFHRPAEGTVAVDGHALTGPRLHRLRRETAWIEPGVRLWNRTLAANLAYGRDGAAGGNVDDAIEAAELADVVARLPDGAETLLGEGGGLLSGGEAQRVRFARELVRVPGARLALLDEPFRGLDREVRARLLGRARTRWRTATLLAVTHDIEHTRDFDRVLVIEGGCIVEDGHPRALAAQPDSRYRRLLDHDVEVRARRWTSPVWRRLWLTGGSARFGDETLVAATPAGPVPR